MNAQAEYAAIRAAMDAQEARMARAGLVYAMLQQKSSGAWIVWDWKRNRRVSSRATGYPTMEAAADAAIADMDHADAVAMAKRGGKTHAPH